MYIYGNNNSCSVNNECETGYSLYFPCIGTFTRGENACFEFYIVNNATKKEIDLRDVDDITLNISGRYNCNFGSFYYPENIKYLQVEKFSEVISEKSISDMIYNVILYIDIVDENHNLIESFLFNKNLYLDIAIEGSVGYFLYGSDEHGILNLKGFDTNTYMFLGWNIDENDGECYLENIYNYLIKDKNLIYNVEEDLVIRAVYQKRREYTIQMAKDNYDSSFVVDYMGKQYFIKDNEFVSVLEGHDVKISCIPNNNVKPYKFNKWEDGYKNPYRVLNINGDELNFYLKAYCTLEGDDREYVDNIDSSILNNFNTIYPEINNTIFLDSHFFDNLYINNCEIDILNDTPYIKIIEGGYVQILNIYDNGNLKLSLNNVGENCNLLLDNHKVSPSIDDNNVFIFEFNGETITLTGNNSCLFGFILLKEIIYEKGKCMLCLSSDDTLKFHPGDLVVEGGVIVNGNPYGIPPVNFAKVTDITPLIM